ncbi:ABC transporter permease [Rathayibacter sp. VKM Ac-2760]|uniref:ABC transporter permease n=1 Tax=Rathayibacter sp. VKM Ac-2760 TaxID=2609253 RepID=UPI0013161BAA|nr:ABC transporter permease [Rathayibacter sp. VKM Ac-2760]QHC58701.1 ABC transporter permease [Rathayibacter sp. VKM Ac-2760]
MSTVTGLRASLDLVLRRERVHASAWYALTALLLLLVAAGIASTYPTPASREELASSVNRSAGELFIIGPLFSPDAGAVELWRILGIATIFVSLASVFTTVRNTRASEENGTIEMLGSAAIGRTAPLVAVLIITAAGSVLAGVIVASGFIGTGASALGSTLAGAQIAMIGLLGAAVAALTGQIMQTSRGATGVAIAVVAAFFLLRGAGDAIGGNAYWISPFGWISAARPFAGDNAAMILPALALAALLAGLALRIAARRDLGAGVFPERSGPAVAGRSLRGPVSLALRTSRGTIIGWSSSALVVGLLIGGVASTVDTEVTLALGSSAGSGSGLVQVALYLSPLFAAILGLQVILRVRVEITSGRAEAVLSRPVARDHWLLGYACAAGLGAATVLMAFGLGIAVGNLGTSPETFGLTAVAGVVRAPAPWVFIALSALLLAVVPRAAAAISFTVVGLFQALEFAVEFRLLPEDALLTSPFALVPQGPDGAAHIWQTIILVFIAAALGLFAARAVRHVDIH